MGEREKGEQDRPGLPAGWGWDGNFLDKPGMRGDYIARAENDGSWAIFRRGPGGPIAEGTATPRPGETLLTAAQRETEEALWRCDGFGVGEVRGLVIDAPLYAMMDGAREHSRWVSFAPDLPGLWCVAAVRHVPGGVEVDARKAGEARDVPAPIEGETLAAYRRRLSLAGADKAAARTVTWTRGAWRGEDGTIAGHYEEDRGVGAVGGLVWVEGAPRHDPVQLVPGALVPSPVAVAETLALRGAPVADWNRCPACRATVDIQADTFEGEDIRCRACRADLVLASVDEAAGTGELVTRAEYDADADEPASRAEPVGELATLLPGLAEDVATVRGAEEQGRASAALVAAEATIARLTAKADAAENARANIEQQTLGQAHTLTALRAELAEVRASAAKRVDAVADEWRAENQRLTAELADRDAMIARLRAELEGTKATLAREKEQSAAMFLDYSGAFKARDEAVSRAEEAERKTLEVQGERATNAAIVAARRDGARVERERCIEAVRAVQVRRSRENYTVDAPRALGEAIEAIEREGGAGRARRSAWSCSRSLTTRARTTRKT